MQITPEFVHLATSRGYTLAVFNRTQVCPDFMVGGNSMLHEPPPDQFPRKRFPECDFGTIAGWAWGYSRILDALSCIPQLDHSRVIATGHSRGGKTALLAGAFDERFAGVFPNDSGTGGAGSLLFHGEGTETIQSNFNLFPDWLPKLGSYIGRENELPFDSHFLKALCAPRPLLCTEAMNDPWANTTGSALSSVEARKAWRFLGAPEEFCGLHFRNGEHGHNPGDWEAMFDFADHTLFGKPIPWDPMFTPYDFN